MKRLYIACCAAVLAVMLALSGCHRDPASRYAKFMAKGKQLLEKKDYARASLEFSNAVQIKPGDAETWYQLALAHLGANRLDQAVFALRKATTLDPKHSAAQIRLASLMVRSRQPAVLEDAVKRLDQVLAVEPQADALDVLAIAEMKLAKPGDAESHLREALAKFPGHLQTSATLAGLLYRKQDFDGAERTLREAVAQAPKSVAASLALAHMLTLEKKTLQAEQELQRALTLDPSDPSTLLMLAALQRSSNRMAEAEQTYRKVAALPNAKLEHVHAAFLLQQGRHEEAIQELRKLAASPSADRTAAIRLAAAYIQARRAGDAVKYLDEYLKKHAKDTDALLLRSRLYLDAGRASDAERDLQQVLHVHPDSVDAHYGLSKASAMLGRERNRRQELGEVLKYSPGQGLARVELAMSLLAEGQAEGALQIIDAAPEQQKGVPRLLSARAWALMSLNRNDEAAAAVDQGLKSGHSPELLVQRGVLASMKKDYTGARRDAEAALALFPTSAAALNLAMESYLAQQQQAGALKMLHDLAPETAKSARMQVQIGQWYQRLGKSEEARASFARAKAVDANFAGADLALASMDASEGKQADARKLLAAVIQRDPRNKMAHLMAAELENMAKDRPAALEHYRQVVEMDPDNVIALNGTAYLMAASDPDQALKYAQHALELAPANPMLQDTIGWVYYRKGMYKNAVEYLTMAAGTSPTPVHEFHLAMACLKTGDRTRGQETLRKALAKDPNLTKNEVGW